MGAKWDEDKDMVVCPFCGAEDSPEDSVVRSWDNVRERIQSFPRKPVHGERYKLS